MSRPENNKSRSCLIELALFGLAFLVLSYLAPLVMPKETSTWEGDSLEKMRRFERNLSLLREADGKLETEAKAFLVPVLAREPLVEEGYLLIGQWKNEANEAHILGLILSADADEEAIMSRVVREWRKAKIGTLDVMVLTTRQREKAEALAKPFFTTAAGKT